MLHVRWPGRLLGARDASPAPLTSAGPGPWAQGPGGTSASGSGQTVSGEGPEANVSQTGDRLSSVRRLQQRCSATCLHSKEVT